MLPLIKADYPARATSLAISFGETEKDGEIRYQIAVEFQIEVTEDRPDLAEFANETITWIGHFTDATAARTMESLQIAGWKGDDVFELNGVPANEVLADLVSLACEPDEYDGKERLKVQWVNRPRGHFAFKKSADATGLRALGARLRATAQSVRAAGGAPRKQAGTGGQPRAGGGYGNQRANQPSGRHPNAPGVDDDIPF